MQSEAIYIPLARPKSCLQALVSTTGVSGGREGDIAIK